MVTKLRLNIFHIGGLFMYLKDENLIWLGTNDDKVLMIPKMANRHGLISGATGTGKTVTLKVLAESFSDMGVPVFLGDIKGDVSGMCKAGEANKHVDERVESMKITDFAYSAYPVRFFDVFGEKGIPVRTTITNMGPELLGRILQLNDTQMGVLNIVFRIADDSGLHIIDMKDLKAMLQYVGDHNSEFQTQYGNVTAQSIGTIQRNILALESSGADTFFGEPALEITDWIQTSSDGKGYINLLHCVKLVQNPLLYSTFLLWMLSDLYETLPEAGDLDKPKMVFFFDEAHLLFNNAPKPLLEKIEQVVRLIRSKGVGIYFITQVPDDIPDSVLSQLGNKVQHALRAYTPKDQKAVKAAAASFRTNPDFDSEKVLGELETGEALISLLDEKGAPNIVQRAYVLPPQSFMGVAEDGVVSGLINGDPLFSKYGTMVDNESAFELLQKKAEEEQQAAEEAQKQAEKEAEEAQKQKELDAEKAKLEKKKERDQEIIEREKLKEDIRKKKKRNAEIEKTVGSLMNTATKEIGNSIIRGLFGTKK